MNIKGEACVIVSSLIFSTLGLFTRELNKELGPISQVSFRISLACLIYFVLFSFKGNFLKVSSINMKKLMVTGFFGYGIMVVLIALSYINTSYGNASTFLQITPIIVIILSAIFLKEHIRKEAIFAAIIAFFGAMIMFRPDLSFLDMGIIFAVLSALMNSIYVILMRDLKKVDIRTKVFYSSLFGGIFLLPFAFLIEKPSLVLSMKSWLIIFGMALANVIGYFILNIGIKMLEANIVGILGVSQALFGIIISYIIDEKFFGYGLLGAFMILSSIVIINIDFPKVSA